MASTYVNDLRLNEMATGDGSGTWGTTTNTNLELIAEAFSYGTEVITTNADTHTTTIADGATDPGRSLYLKYTGTLDSACTITIGPNTVSKVWIIENGTSGSQDIIISQGSGANITIPAGDTKVVYSDGAGAGAAFFDAFASLSVVDLKVQDDLTVTDDASIGGDATITGTLGVTGDITGTLATAAQPNITSVGTLTGFTSTGIDDNADATAITIDSDENVSIGYASPNARFTVGTASGQNIEFYPENTTDTNMFQNYDRTATAYQKIETRAAEHIFSIGSSEKMRIDSSGNVGIGTSSPSYELDIQSSSGDAEVAITGSTTNNAVLKFENITNNTLADIYADNSKNLIFRTNGTTERLRIDSSGDLYCSGGSGGTILTLTASSGTTSGDIGRIRFGNNNIDSNLANIVGYQDGATDSGGLKFETQPTGGATVERLRIDSSGSVRVNNTSGLDGQFSSLAGASYAGAFANTSAAYAPIYSWNRATSGNNLFCEFFTGSLGSLRGTIDYNRGAGLVRYNTSSDATLKNIIGDSDGVKSVEILNSTRIREFAWKDDETQKPQIGVIAQELYETYKGAVSVGGDLEKTDDEGNVTTEYQPWAVDKTAFTFHLVAGWQVHEKIIQEQQALIESLEARITALES
jgi:hypothetical protein